jgi:hypothetical protein
VFGIPVSLSQAVAPFPAAYYSSESGKTIILFWFIGVSSG